MLRAGHDGPTGTTMADTLLAPAPPKPTWRGRLHQIAFIASIPLGLALVDHRLQIIQTNNALVRLLGLRGKDLMGQPLMASLGLSAADQDLLEKKV